MSLHRSQINGTLFELLDNFTLKKIHNMSILARTLERKQNRKIQKQFERVCYLKRMQHENAWRRLYVKYNVLVITYFSIPYNIKGLFRIICNKREVYIRMADLD